MNENRILEILMKETSGELSSTDRVYLDEFISTSASNSAFVKENRAILQHMPDFEVSDNMFNADQALQKVKAQMQPTAKVIDLKPKKESTSVNWQLWAAAATFLIGLSTIAYLYLGSFSDSEIYATTDNIQVIELSDGSEVTLNQHSTLTLSDDFGVHLRELHLEGEAYFKVKNKDDQPFIVKAGELEVEVIGTEFNVRNRTNSEDVGVFVEEGKVKVTALNTGSKVLLSARESAGYDKSTKMLLKDQQGKTNATSWMSDKLSFKDVSLSLAIKEIENHFNIDITLENTDLAQCKYTSIFNGAEADEVLETMSAVFDVQILKQSDTSFQLSGGNCN